MSTRTPATSVPDILRAFRREFQPITGKFSCFRLQRDSWREHSLTAAARPGVYVWFDKSASRVVRVGLSLINARARALQHIRDNTGGKMTALADKDSLLLILFTVAEQDKHWASALEIYLEQALVPTIPAKH